MRSYKVSIFIFELILSSISFFIVIVAWINIIYIISLAIHMTSFANNIIYVLLVLWIILVSDAIVYPIRLSVHIPLSLQRLITLCLLVKAMMKSSRKGSVYTYRMLLYLSIFHHAWWSFVFDLIYKYEQAWFVYFFSYISIFLFLV